MDCSWRELDCIPHVHVRHKASLELLDLSNNNLNVLPEGAFSGFIKLKALDLSSNHISAINGDMFIGLNILQTFNISHNSLRSIPDGAFSGLNMLQTLDMSHNLLQSLPDYVFSGLPNLLSLYLSPMSGLGLDSVYERTFSGLHKLKTLYLPEYVKLYGSPFKYLYSLQTLSLSTWTVTRTTFAGLHDTLQVLYISTENITPNCTFVQLSSLQHLELLIASCHDVNEKLFSGLVNLSSLKLTMMYATDCSIDLSPLTALTHLSYQNTCPWTSNIHTCIQTLNSLNSPLQTLELHLDCFCFATFNSDTFESLPKWKESLQELRIYSESANGMQIEGSPFQVVFTNSSVMHAC